MTQSPRRSRSPRRSARGPVSALLGVGALLAGAGGVYTAAYANDWPELRGDVTRRGVTEEKLVPPLSLLWRFTSGPQSPNPVAPVVVGNVAYFATRGIGDVNTGNAAGGVVYAVDTNTGARLWQYPRETTGLRDRNTFQTAPLVANGKVYIGASDGNMYVLDAKNGSEVVKFRTGRAINSSPAIVDGVLLFGSNDGTFYALNPETGEPAWKQFYKPNDSINSAPIVADTMLFFTTNDNSVHGVKEVSGIFRWKQRLQYRILANAPIFADGSLYVPAGPRLYALQPNSGQVRWARDLPSDILVAPVSADGVIYLMSREQQGGGTNLYAVRSNNGRDFWAKPVTLPVSPSAAPTISGDIIYIPTAKNVIMAVSREDGRVLWQYTTQASYARPTFPAAYTATPFSAPLAISNGTLFAVSDDGSLSAFRPDAPDATGPEFTNMYPPAARAVSGQPPVTLAVSVSDPGSGLNPASVEVKLDDQPVSASYDSDRGLVYYQTKASGKIVDKPLGDGRHTISVTAADWRGNKSETTWSFIVNNALPPASRGEAPKITNRPGPANGGQPGQPGQPGAGPAGTPGNNPAGAPGGRRGGGRRGGGTP